MYEEYEVYGPYSRPDGRLHVCLVKRDINSTIIERMTVSYPKYRMECILNRYLEIDEQVHHKDLNHANNEDNNFEVLKRPEHRKHHTEDISKIIWICEFCRKEFNPTIHQVRNKKCKPWIGIFCSRSCNGKVNH